MRRFTMTAFATVAALALAGGPSGATEASRETLAEKAIALFERDLDARGAAIDFFVQRQDPDAAAALIFALRVTRDPRIAEALTAVTGKAGLATWFDWMLWQEAHPEIVPFDGFDAFHADLHALLDPNFRVFLKSGVEHEIRLEEIVWGGVGKDDIPALTDPRLIDADAADYLNDGDLVFGVAIAGDARAYPLRILDWHEMLNDTVGGVPVSLAYCTLCGSGILFDTTVEGYPEPFVFGTSGLLYRSNKLMYDSLTHSLWNQFTGRPVVGPLTNSGIELKTRPVVITRWVDWRRDHPETRVLDIETGHWRNYGPGAAYAHYFDSPDLMFPALVDQSQQEQKSYVFALRAAPVEKAWPLELFAGGAVINDTAGVLSLVLIGDDMSRTVRAYRSDDLVFEKGADLTEVVADGVTWRVTEDALIEPGGRTLPRLPGHVAYWFAWSGYFGAEGEVGGE